MQFIRFHNKQPPKWTGKPEIEPFLSHLALHRNVAAATQNQAMNAIFFLYREVLHIPMEEKIEAVRSSKPKRLPTVLSRAEVKRLLSAREGTNRLKAQLLYGSGLRLIACTRLRYSIFTARYSLWQR